MFLRSLHRLAVGRDMNSLRAFPKTLLQTRSNRDLKALKGGGLRDAKALTYNIIYIYRIWCYVIKTLRRGDPDIQSGHLQDPRLARPNSLRGKRLDADWNG